MSQITVNRKELSKALAIVKRTTGKRPAHPILDSVLVTTHGQSIELATTDLECATRIDLESTSDGIAGEVQTFCLPVKAFAAAVKGSKAERVVIEPQADHAVSFGAAGAPSGMIIRGSDPDEYPVLPDGQDHETAGQFPTATLGEALKQVSYAACTDPTRYNLNGVFVEDTGDATVFTATDGHRLAQSRIGGQLEGCGDSTGELESERKGWILPLPFVKALEALTACRKPAADTTYLTRFGDSIGAQVGCVTLYCKRIDGEYPNYRQVIPERNGRVVCFQQADALAGLAEVWPCLNERSYAVRAELNGRLELLASNPDLGEATAAVEAECATGLYGEKFGVNASYLRAALESLGAGAVTLNLGKGDVWSSPLLLTGENAPEVTAVVMPMRI